MSTKSLKTQLLAAVAMCLVAVIALGSSTFAWFAANNKVSATDMTVTAKSNSQYLLIGDNEENAKTAKTDANDTALTTSHKALYADSTTNVDQLVYPTYFSGTETGALPGTSADTEALVTMTAGKWYTAQNKNANAASDKVFNDKELRDDELANYRLTYKAWLTLSKDSEDYTGTVKMIAEKTDGSDAATSVAVKIGDKVYKLNEAGAAGVEVGGKNGGFFSDGVTTTTDITLKKDTAVPVEIYVYVNGASTNVNSDYINTENQKVTGTATVSFELTNEKATSTGA